MLNGIKDILVEAKNYDKPNFFSMGYYLTFSKEPLPNMPVVELNKFLRTYLDDNFMLDFINDAKLGLINSASKALEYKKEFVSKFDYYKEEFLKENLVKEETDKLLKEIKELVNNSIDRLETIKDSIAYTMSQSLKADIDQYYSAISKNKKEQARFNGQTIKYEKMVKGGRTPEWKVAPLSLIDLVYLQETIVDQIERLKDHYVELISKFDSRDFDSESISTIDFLKENASGVVNKITPQMARNKAITLMEEVGISEPRRRYYQYPFEFSGGMRQRIVIAIALAANPDILICDEPTTALDVTIQAQILELINKLKAQRKLAIIFITHDLGVVANMADRIAVMYAGKIVEYGTSEDIFYDPRHPYTWALLSSMPDLDTNDKLEAIPGTPPNMIYPPKGEGTTDFSKYLKNNTVDVLFGVGWTGSALDPYGLMEAYVAPNYQYDPAWDTSSTMLDIEIGGYTLRASVFDWGKSALSGDTIKALIVEDGVLTNDYVMIHCGTTCKPEIRLDVLAAVEGAVLDQYDMIPTLLDASATLKGMKIKYGVEEYVFGVGRGGIKYMTFNYTDDEWAQYIANSDNLVDGVLPYKK